MKRITPDSPLEKMDLIGVSKPPSISPKVTLLNPQTGKMEPYSGQENPISYSLNPDTYELKYNL